MAAQSLDASQSKSLIDLIANADLTVQFVILLLVVASIWAWSIIINKSVQLKKTQKQIQKIVKLSHNYSAVEINKFLAGDTGHDYAFFKNLIKTHDLHYKHTKEKNDGLFADAVSLLKDQFLGQLEKGTNILATISSSAPFIGLFGTVWGIMHSFQSIAASKNTSLVTVAPGIAEALFATGLGLVAAIPALIFYNTLNHKINETESQLNVAIHSLLAKLR